MKDKIKIEELAAYLAWELRFYRPYLIYSGNPPEPDHDEWGEDTLTFENFNQVLESGMTPLVLPLSELKNKLELVLISVCKFDLSGHSFDYYEGNNNDNFIDNPVFYNVNASNSNGVVVASLTFDGNIFSIYHRGVPHPELGDFVPVCPQYGCWNELFRHHFDVFNWLNRGLALNKNDYGK